MTNAIFTLFEIAGEKLKNELQTFELKKLLTSTFNFYTAPITLRKSYAWRPSGRKYKIYFQQNTGINKKLKLNDTDYKISFVYIQINSLFVFLFFIF